MLKLPGFTITSHSHSFALGGKQGQDTLLTQQLSRDGFPHDVFISPENKIAILGNGEMGDKARELLQSTERLRRLGLNTPQRVVLTQEFLDPLFQNNKLGNGLGQFRRHSLYELFLRKQNKGGYPFERLMAAKWSSDQKLVLNAVAAFFAGSFLMVRSSAVNDARGIGIYTSVPSLPNSTSLDFAIKKVLASYESEKAKAYRERVGTDLGMGIILEPVVGNKYDEEYVAPIISGVAFTGIGDREAVLRIVPGIGSGVDIKNPLVVNESSYGDYSSLLDYIYGIERNDFAEEQQIALSCFEGVYKSNTQYGVSAKFAYQYGDGAEFGYGTSFTEEDFLSAIEKINLRVLFQALKRIRQEIGESYLEWAITFENGKPQISILQIAPMTLRPEIDHSSNGALLFSGRASLGTARKNCQHIVFIQSRLDLEKLAKFNDSHANYLLIYPTRATFNTQYLAIRPTFANIHRVGALLEISSKLHVERPESHWEGLLDVSDIPLGQIHKSDFTSSFLEFEKKVFAARKFSGLTVYDGNFVVLSDERTGRFEVRLEG